jgi:hypothetical protein
MITALRTAAGHHGPAHAVVAHSMGGRARLHVTHGLGHHRILRDEGVIAASVDFLMAGSGC